MNTILWVVMTVLSTSCGHDKPEVKTEYSVFTSSIEATRNLMDNPRIGQDTYLSFLSFEPGTCKKIVIQKDLRRMWPTQIYVADQNLKRIK